MTTKTRGVLQPDGSMKNISALKDEKKTYLINGDFSEWQRGLNFVAPADNSYSSDAWKVISGGGVGVTINHQPDPPRQYVMEVLNINTVPVVIGQVIPDYQKLLGKYVTMSLDVKTSTPGTCRIGIKSAGGLTDIFEDIAIDTNWKRVNVIGKVDAGDNNIYVYIQNRLSGVAGDIFIDSVVLVAGIYEDGVKYPILEYKENQNNSMKLYETGTFRFDEETKIIGDFVNEKLNVPSDNDIDDITEVPFSANAVKLDAGGLKLTNGVHYTMVGATKQEIDLTPLNAMGVTVYAGNNIFANYPITKNGTHRIRRKIYFAQRKINMPSVGVAVSGTPTNIAGYSVQNISQDSFEIELTLTHAGQRGIINIDWSAAVTL